MSKSKSNLLEVENASKLSVPTISPPHWDAISPRWLLRFLKDRDAYFPIDGGVYRINILNENYLPVEKKVNTPIMDLPVGNLSTQHSHIEGAELDISYARYEQNPMEIHLQPIQSIVKIHTRVGDLYSSKHDQIMWQLYLSAQSIYETIEHIIINHKKFGLISQCHKDYFLKYSEPPSPDILDELLSRSWKYNDVFVMHPKTLDAFQSECNKLGLELEYVDLYGEKFPVWRGLPIITSNKILITEKSPKKKKKTTSTIEENYEKSINDKSLVLLMRFGAFKMGCFYLYPNGKEGSLMFPNIDIEFMGIDDNSVASYLLTAYAAIAVATPSALSIAEVQI